MGQTINPEPAGIGQSAPLANQSVDAQSDVSGLVFTVLKEATSDSQSDLSTTEQQLLQKTMDSQSKAVQTLSNVEKKSTGSDAAMVSNIK